MSTMKPYLLGLFIFFISTTAHSRLFDNGWNSSGGGEYILDRHNPWFFELGAVESLSRADVEVRPIKYCIDHGGEKYFSLPKEKAGHLISEVMSKISNQMARLTKVDQLSWSEEFDYMNLGRWIRGACGSLDIATFNGVTNYDACDVDLHDMDYEAKSQKAYLSTHFKEVPNCADAELEIILGNVENPKVKKLMSLYGKESFQKKIGEAIRTSFSYDQMRAKGFVYMAADRGELAYSGQRSSFLSEENDIWNLLANIPSGVNLPRSFSGVNYYWSKLEKQKFINHMEGPFKLVFAHELSHTFGLKHIDGTYMDENFPADLVGKGFISESESNIHLDMLNNSLIDIEETSTRIRLGRMADYPFNEFSDTLMKRTPFIYRHFLKLEEEGLMDTVPNYNFLQFEINTPESGRPSQLKVLDFEKDKFEYVLYKNYEIEMSKECSAPEVISNITFRSMLTLPQRVQILDPDTHEIRNSYENQTTVVDDILIGIWNRSVCGRILIEGKEVDFKLQIKNNESSLIELTDPDTGLKYIEIVRPLDVSPMNEEELPPLIYDLPVIEFIGLPA